MSRRRFLLASLTAAVTALGFAGAVHADGQPADQTLERAFEQAAAARLSLRVADLDIQAAQARVAQAKARFYPSLALVGNVDVINNYDSFTGITGSVEIPSLGVSSNISVTSSIPRYRTGIGLQATYDLYSGGRDVAQLHQNRLALEAAGVSHRLAVQKVALDVSRAYFTLRRECILYEGATRRLESSRTDREQAHQRLLSGHISDIAARTADLSFAEQESAQRAQALELDNARVDYMAAIGTANVSPAAPDAVCRFGTDINTDLNFAESLSDRSLDNTYQTLQWKEAQAQVTIERAALKPQVHLYARYTGIGRDTGSLADAWSNLGKEQAAVGMEVSFNLFDGWLTRQRVAESRALAERQRLQAEIAATTLKKTLRRADSAVKLAASRVTYARARLNLEQARAGLARERVKSGSGTATAMHEQVDRARDAADDLQVAQINLALAKLDRLFPAEISITEEASN